MFKKVLPIFLLCATAMMWSCSDSNVIEDNVITPSEQTNNGPRVSVNANGQIYTPEQGTRAVFNTDATTAYPTLQNFTTGSTVNIVCIFRSTDASQPTTKVQLEWDVLDNNRIQLHQDQTFNMATGTDLSKGTWYMMGMYGGTPVTNNGQISSIQFKRFMKFTKPGEQIDADIPFIFGWRSLKVLENGALETTRPIDLMPMGTFVWLHVKNNTGFDIRYSGVRMISSSPTEGSFDLSNSALTAAGNITDTERGLSATNDIYSSLLTFKGENVSGQYEGSNGFNRSDEYERVKSGWKMQTTGLYYNDASIGQDIKVANGASDDDNYLCVWIMPQKQKISVYNSQGGENANWNKEGDVREVMKTQFMLHSTPDDEAKHPAINMLPVFGTKDNFISGQASSIKQGNAVYKNIPLQYMAKLNNFNPDEDYADTKAVYSNSTLYTREEMQENANKLTSNSKYQMPGREYWQSIMGPYGYQLFVEKDPTSGSWKSNDQQTYSGVNNYNSFMQVSNFGNVKRTYMNTVSSKRFTFPLNGSEDIAYALCLSKPYDFLTNPQMGDLYEGAHVTVKKPASKDDFFSFWGENGKYTASNAPAVTTTNELQHIIRASVEGLGTAEGRVKLQDRYLGSNFVLDMSDISEEKFWETQRTSGKQDIYRYMPLTGIYSSDNNVTTSGAKGSNDNFSFKNQGTSGQYWINEVMNEHQLVETQVNPLNPNVGNGITKRANWSYCAISFNQTGGKETHRSGYYTPLFNPADPNCKAAVRLITRRPSVD